jgi:hypothetical protein
MPILSHHCQWRTWKGYNDAGKNSKTMENTKFKYPAPAGNKYKILMFKFTRKSLLFLTWSEHPVLDTEITTAD